MGGDSSGGSNSMTYDALVDERGAQIEGSDPWKVFFICPGQVQVRVCPRRDASFNWSQIHRTILKILLQSAVQLPSHHTSNFEQAPDHEATIRIDHFLHACDAHI